MSEPQTPSPRPRGCRRAAIALAVLALTALLVHRPLLRALPGLLIERSEAVAADAIVVLAGEHRGLRVDAALELFRAGHLAEGPLLMSGGELYPGTSWAQLMKERAVAGGVPAERILLQGRSTTTVEDARFSLPLLELPPKATVLLVTSPWHSGRAAKIFRREAQALGRELRFVSCPGDQGYPEDWWTDANGARAMAMELLKRVWWGEGS